MAGLCSSRNECFYVLSDHRRATARTRSCGPAWHAVSNARMGGKLSAGQNGRRRPSALRALVIDADVQSQLELRSALRATGLFGVILSAETALIAHDAMNGPDAMALDLVLVASSMLNSLALANGPAASDARFAVVAKADARVPDNGWPVLRKPVRAADIEQVFIEPRR
jgi:hypothetical protein